MNDTIHDPVIVFENVTKRFKKTTALDSVSLQIAQGAIVGLVGRNGSGKSTLLQHMTGLQLPTAGHCSTFGIPSERLGGTELTRIGVVQQHAKLLGWMRVSQLIAYVGTFYARWDREMIASLMERLHLAPNARVDSLSPGHVQSVSLILALAHHPELLLLDEPLSDLDPTARHEVIALLLDYYNTHACTMVVSSHLLHDIEPLINSLVALTEGRVTANAELDALKEQYVEWLVTARSVALPMTWAEPQVIRSEGDAQSARLTVHATPAAQAELRAALAARHGADIETRALNLERLFPLITQHRSNGTTASVSDRADAADGLHASR